MLTAEMALKPEDRKLEQKGEDSSKGVKKPLMVRAEMAVDPENKELVITHEMGVSSADRAISWNRQARAAKSNAEVSGRHHCTCPNCHGSPH